MYGTTAIFLSGLDVEIAANATAAAATAASHMASVGGLFGPVAWGCWLACLCLLL